MSGCSRWNFTGGLPETSNCYCHPGIAGGSPAYASAGKLLPDFGLHQIDVNLTMGNLLSIVADETRTYLTKKN